jgi:hypothetical protein
MHLNAHKITVQGSWFPTMLSRFTLPLFVIGGAATGFLVSMQFCGDDQLRRLAYQHEQDRVNQIESQRYVPLFPTTN